MIDADSNGASLSPWDSISLPSYSRTREKQASEEVGKDTRRVTSSSVLTPCFLIGSSYTIRRVSIGWKRRQRMTHATVSRAQTRLTPYSNRNISRMDTLIIIPVSAILSWRVFQLPSAAKNIPSQLSKDPRYLVEKTLNERT